MIVFDASGSMSGNGWGHGSDTKGHVTRIDKVRASLGKVLPNITRFRRVGLITYGPGPWQQCNVHLNLEPTANAAAEIMGVVSTLTPSGKTPLTASVVQAAEVLHYRTEAGVVVLLTDDEETCGGSPCSVAKLLRSAARQLTVHVIGLRVKNYTWTGEQSVTETKCLANETGGYYITVETEDELTEALQKTLGLPDDDRAAISALRSARR